MKPIDEGIGGPPEEWEDIRENEIREAYRLRFPLHVYPQCKKNCRANPRCYSGLGESAWTVKKSDKKEENPSFPERRETGVPAGLKNLGNTCYVNSYLQIWFHNIKFRQALYLWDPEQDAEERDNETLLEAENYVPRGKVSTLQSLFASMEFTNRRAVDPNDFIAKLGLDPQVQQDAQEFSKLFTSLLESSLSNQKNSFVQSIVQNQFRGEYSYITECIKCKKESKRPSFFYELDLTLQGHKTLIDCLSDFTKKEKLDGDNQYFCESCNSKQDATRYVGLNHLPPVLNLQLNRFIFDMQTGRKKKLNSFVQFPEQLDMSQYLGRTKGTNVYSLTGVLMHVGAEANHGHYIAHIREPRKREWFRFSDAFVEKLGKSPKLGSEQASGKSSTKNRVLKGNQGSNNAYMLVYTEEDKEVVDECKKKPSRKGPRLKKKLKETSEDEMDLSAEECGELITYPSDFPIYLRARIELDRRVFDEEIKEALMSKKLEQSQKINLHKRLQSICERIPYKDDQSSSFEFVPTEWLIHYFERPSAASMIDTRPFLCVHGKLDIEKLNEVKVVDSNVAEELFDEAGDATGGIRLGKDSLCEVCVKNRYRQVQLAKISAVDAKSIAEWLKEPVDTLLSSKNKCYWVGKLSIKRWKAIAKKNLEDLISRETATFKLNSNYVEEDIKSGSSKGDDENSENENAKNVPNGVEKEVDANINNGGESEFINGEDKPLKKTQSVESMEIASSGGGSLLTVKEVQIRLQRIGTNVTVAKVKGSFENNKEHFQSCDQLPSSDSNGKHSSSNGDEPLSNGKVHNANGANSVINDDVPSPNKEFNEDIVCAHGNLCIEESRRKLVSEKVWSKFRSYFPLCREFEHSDPPRFCPNCEDGLIQAAKDHEYKKEEAQNQKSLLSDILNERNRPTWSKPSLNKVYLISRAFVRQWRQFVRNPGSTMKIQELCNAILLCKHGGLVYPLDLDTESDYESVDSWNEDKKSVFMVWEEEWENIKKLFIVDHEISVVRSLNGPLLQSDPEVCQECVQLRCEEEEQEKLTYQNVAIYIRRLAGAEKLPESDARDPDFLTADSNGGEDSTTVNAKKIKLNNGSATNGDSSNGSSLRRSNRRQKVRGEREFTVSSDMLLRDLKVKIMEMFKVPPFDQNLCLNGIYLSDSCKTLGELRVLPGSLIYLRADEPSGNVFAAEADEGWSMHHPEEGFKGTGLLSGF